jgi:hypothetical protein
MASTIKLKNGSGAPTTGDLVQGEPALDLTNKRLYTENASGVVIEVGTNPSTIDINAAQLTAQSLVVLLQRLSQALQSQGLALYLLGI